MAPAAIIPLASPCTPNPFSEMCPNCFSSLSRAASRCKYPVVELVGIEPAAEFLGTDRLVVFQTAPPWAGNYSASVRYAQCCPPPKKLARRDIQQGHTCSLSVEMDGGQEVVLLMFSTFSFRGNTRCNKFGDASLNNFFVSLGSSSCSQMATLCPALTRLGRYVSRAW